MKSTTYLFLSLLFYCVIASTSSAQSIVLVTNLNDAGTGSLREAITLALPGDTIQFSVTGTITLTSGPYSYGNSVIIDGPGMDLLTLSAGYAFRVFDISSGSTTLKNLTLTEGQDSTSGHGIYFTGDTLVLDSVTVSACGKSSITSDAFGGGIYADCDKVVLKNSILRNNWLFGDSLLSGLTNGAGGYLKANQIELYETIVDSNEQQSGSVKGAGLSIYTGNLIAEGCSFMDNTNTGSDTISGAGLFLESSTPLRSEIKNCIFHNNINHANYIVSSSDAPKSCGGGAYIQVMNAPLDPQRLGVLIEHSTFTDNSAIEYNSLSPSSYSRGGAIHLRGNGKIIHSMFDGNEGNHGAGVYSDATEDTLWMMQDTLQNNVGTGGGAVHTNTLTSTFLDGLTILNNDSKGVYGAANYAFVIKNSFISGNTVGAINLFNLKMSSAQIYNNTIYANTAPVFPGIYLQFGDSMTYIFNNTLVDQNNVSGSINGREVRLEFGKMTLRNNIITSSTLLPNPIISKAFPSDSIFSEGGNIMLDSSGIAFLDHPTDIHNTNPQLDVFGAHGGPTDTWSLQAISPAINYAGVDTLSTDGRGFLRDSLIDAGAFEFGAVGPAAPSVVAQSSDTTVCEGDSLMLFVNATGGGVLAFEWQFEGTPISGATDSIYTIFPILGANEGEYRCIINNVAGADTSALINLNVSLLSFTSILDTICAGDSILFEGNWYKTPGIYTDTLITSIGCDSVRSLELTVLSLPGVSMDPFLPDTICQGGTAFALPLATPVGGIYAGPGVSGTSFLPSTAGIGDHYVTYSFTDATGCSASDSSFIFVEICTSLLLNRAQGFILSPNPSSSKFELRGHTEGAKISILDVHGARIMGVRIIAHDQRIEVDLSDHPNGIYFLAIEHESLIKTYKLIKL